MEKLKEYAWVVVAIVTVMTSLGSLGLWAIHVQIIPEIRRLDGSIDLLTDRIERMDKRFEARTDNLEARFDRIENGIKTILLRLPKQQDTG